MVYLYCHALGHVLRALPCLKEDTLVSRTRFPPHHHRGPGLVRPRRGDRAAAPALAASAPVPCAPGPVTVNLIDGTRTVLSTGPTGMPTMVQYVTTDPTTGVTTTVTATAIGSTILGQRTGYALDDYLDTNLTYDGTGFNIQQVTTGTAGEGQNVTVAFSRNGSPVEVSGFSAFIDDIDNKAGNWFDGVSFPSGNPLSVAPGANIDGDGSASTTGTYSSGPYHHTAASAQPGINRPGDRLSLSASSVSQFSFSYTNLGRINDISGAGKEADQNIQLTGITFQAPACI